MTEISAELRGTIDAEVVSTITKLMAEVLGARAIDVITRRCAEKGGNPSGRELILEFAGETQTILGSKGAFATLRQVGRDLAKSIMADHPRQDWETMLEKGLNDLGFAEKIEKQAGCAFICRCVFYDILQQRGLEPVEHAVCWAGWGFIEGFMKALRGVKGIEWARRDVTAEKCEFRFN